MSIVLSIPVFLTGGPLDGLKVTIHLAGEIVPDELTIEDETYLRKLAGDGRQWRGSDGSWVYRHPSAPEGAE